MRGEKALNLKEEVHLDQEGHVVKSAISSILYYLAMVVFLFSACQETHMISHLIGHALVPNDEKHILYINLRLQEGI